MTPQTLSLTDFLLARIADDEAATRAFVAPDTGRGFIYGRDVDPGRTSDADAYEGFGGPADPDRVLAECEAKRRIVAGHQMVEFGHGGDFEGDEGWRLDHVCGTCTGCCDDWSDHIGPCATLRALATVYADHPDFREEWQA